MSQRKIETDNSVRDIHPLNGLEALTVVKLSYIVSIFLQIGKRQKQTFTRS